MWWCLWLVLLPGQVQCWSSQNRFERSVVTGRSWWKETKIRRDRPSWSASQISGDRRGPVLCSTIYICECPLVVTFLHLLDVLWHCSDMEEVFWIYYNLIFIVTLTTELLDQHLVSMHAQNKWCAAEGERELEIELTNYSVTELKMAHVPSQCLVNWMS